MTHARRAAITLFTLPLALIGLQAHAQTGLYVGGGIGFTGQQLALEPLGELTVSAIEDNGFAWKAFAGINLDVPFIDLAVEAGYVDLGSPEASLQGVNEASLDTTGFDAFAVVALDAGPAAVFAKLGVVVWDLDISTVPAVPDLGDSGTNLAGGIGARFSIGPIQLRGEAEYFAIDQVDDSYLLSTSVVWQF